MQQNRDQRGSSLTSKMSFSKTIDHTKFWLGGKARE